MTFQPLYQVLLALCCAILIPSTAIAAPQNKPTGTLTEKGRKLEARYQKDLDALRAQLTRAIPKVGEAKKKAFLAARLAETNAATAQKDAEQAASNVATAQALVNHAKGKWIGGADRGINAAKSQLEKAKDQSAREAAQKELAKWQENRKEGVAALKERQANLDRARKEQPKLEKASKQAKEAVKRAQASTSKALKSLRLIAKLSRSTLDARLAKFVILSEATPRRLAAFAQAGIKQQQLVSKLLADSDLMLQMAVADGAKGGAYGRAMEIYSQIMAKGRPARNSALQRLAVAIALEHATPIAQRNPEATAGVSVAIDPVARFLHYQTAFEDGQLDPCFKGLSIWDYRMVVDGNEPDETLAWGREMLQSYRPDHVYTSDYRWRYVAAVRTDIRYGSQDNKHDRPELQFFQNILMNGGVCGRRAFFGRFSLRAFGVPTVARPQRGHAALAHWTPDGWVVCLGGGWGAGWTKTRYNKDLDFLATTQARRNHAQYMQIKRAQWIGDIEGEKPVYGLLSGVPGFWYSVSLYRQRMIIKDSKATTLKPVGAELGEAEDTRGKYQSEAANVTDEDRAIKVSQGGVITIPAVACSSPKKSGRKILFLPSNLGGKQLHYSRNGGATDFEYTFTSAVAGRYRLTARVATPSWQQRLKVLTNESQTPAIIDLPHTIGLWGQTTPVEIDLIAGSNVIRFSHENDGYAKGFSIKDFTLTPTF
jgi:hypothetical protein